jgi:hypothetical protein
MAGAPPVVDVQDFAHSRFGPGSIGSVMGIGR